MRYFFFLLSFLLIVQPVFSFIREEKKISIDLPQETYTYVFNPFQQVLSFTTDGNVYGWGGQNYIPLSLQHLPSSQGYVFFPITSSSLVLKGELLSEIEIKSGYSLIGIPNDKETSLRDLVVAEEGKPPVALKDAKDKLFTALIGYKTELGRFEPLDIANEEIKLKPGVGYFIKAVKPFSLQLKEPSPSQKMLLAAKQKRAVGVRLLAQTPQQLKAAVSRGCTVVQQVKTLRAVSCPKEVAPSLKLKEDPIFFALDEKSNTQINADALQTLGTKGKGRKIVILDTGYNYNHPELRSSYLGGRDFVNKDEDPLDDDGHGSHVAGIITADGVDPRAKGVAPEVGIIAGKVLNKFGFGLFSDILAAIYWAVDGPDGIPGTPDDFKADAISMSIGTFFGTRDFCDTVLPELTEAITYAKDRGIVVVVAAGNNGFSVSLPGCIRHSTTVAAVDSSDTVAFFSGRGIPVDIAAPGVSIYSSVLGKEYASFSGTSMATPMVSGVVALIKERHPQYTPQQVEAALFTTAKDLGAPGKDNDFGHGRVDALLAATRCDSDSDCQEKFCHPIKKVCTKPTCSDGFTNQDESDVDCGGICIAQKQKCKDGQLCGGKEKNCISNNCDPKSGRCAKISRPCLTCNPVFTRIGESRNSCLPSNCDGRTGKCIPSGKGFIKPYDSPRSYSFTIEEEGAYFVRAYFILYTSNLPGTNTLQIFSDQKQMYSVTLNSNKFDFGKYQCKDICFDIDPTTSCDPVVLPLGHLSEGTHSLRFQVSPSPGHSEIIGFDILSEQK